MDTSKKNIINTTIYNTKIKNNTKNNDKRFKKNFKNWTSGNKNIDELIQQSQLNALHSTKCLEFIPFENLKNITYITRGGLVKFIQLTGLKERFILGILKIKNGIDFL